VLNENPTAIALTLRSLEPFDTVAHTITVDDHPALGRAEGHRPGGVARKKVPGTSSAPRGTWPAG
jgi:hypothetical protein